MSLFEDTAAIGLNAIDEFAGQDAIYARGQQTFSLRVIPGAAMSMDTGGDAVTLAKSFDFYARPADLKINNVAIKPQRGDQIRWRGEVYFVLPSSGDSSFSESDSHEFLFEIHTTKKPNVPSD